MGLNHFHHQNRSCRVCRNRFTSCQPLSQELISRMHGSVKLQMQLLQEQLFILIRTPMTGMKPDLTVECLVRYSEEDDDGGDGDEEEEDEEYMDQETVDEFEDRVLNKRAAKLHFKMKKLFQDASSLTYADIEKKKDTKKDGAQKFYSLLVLQKFETLDISQTSIYGDLNIVKGPTFDSDSALVN